MDIKHSRHILVVGPPNSGALEVIRDLTGSAPPLNDAGSTAGLAHEWDAQTPYYTAKVPIWIDEIADTAAWQTEFLKPEAKEVVEAIGAWIFCFRPPQNGRVGDDVEEALKAIQDVSEEHVGYGADALMLAVAKPLSKAMASTEDDGRHGEWEDVCLQYGFEYIDYAGQGMNEFREKTGFERLKEALEANDWASSNALDDEEGELDFEDLEGDLDGFTRDEAEMTAELFGMKAALAGADDFEPNADEFVSPNQQENQVEDLDRLMGKLLAVKEQSADLPPEQRKRMAAKAVKELMQDDSTV